MKVKHPYLLSLKYLFEVNGNKENAEQMKAYLKDKFEFYGIKTPERRTITKQIFKHDGLPDKSEYFTIVKELWNLPEREYQHFGQEMVEKSIKKIEKKDAALLEYMITHKSWWDTVDFIATKLVGPYFKKYPEQIIPVTQKWIASDNMWLQRTAILFQLKYKKATDLKLLSSFILEMQGSKEFFINKAIGWALREHSKTDPDWVVNFVQNNQLAPLSEREALKRIEKN
jgi:3-methyladenine DNA glycosylase AlkD